MPSPTKDSGEQPHRNQINASRHFNLTRQDKYEKLVSY
jgi:hypothetical protein